MAGEQMNAPGAAPAPAPQGAPGQGWATFWHKVTRLFLDRFDRVSLAGKLVTSTLLVLIIGTVGISYSIRQLVGNYQLEKLDTQLIQQSQIIYTGAELDLLKNGGVEPLDGIPNSYFMQVRDTNNRHPSNYLEPRSVNGVSSMPQLPALGSSNVSFGQPFTTPAIVTVTGTTDRAAIKAAHADWRVIALKVMQGDEWRYIAYIGLSMGDVHDTIDTLTRYSATVGAAIVLLGGSLSALIFQRTLVPLKRIEKTAAKIAAGDLSQRIPAAPENTEVGSLSASLNTMLAQIESSFREQQETTEKMKRFVSDVSHELRTPLAAIHGYAELYSMQRDMPGALERADESIAHIERSSQRMTVLVEDLLSLARLDEGRGIDMTQQVTIDSLIKDAADDLHALDPERKVSRGVVTLRPATAGADGVMQPAALAVTAIPAGELPQITLTGDASRLRQVVTNIVGNIHRYTPADSPAEIGLGVLTASVAPEVLVHMPATADSMRRFIEAAEVGSSMQVGTNYAVLRFEDHGPGVPEASLSQLFERFYTADPSRAREKGGTGLGLAIAQSVVKAHKGFICATGTPGGGLTFTIVLPLGPATPPVAPEADASQPPQRKSKDKTKSWFSKA